MSNPLVTPRGRTSSVRETWLDRIRTNRAMAAIITGCVLVNGLLLWPADETDREYYETYVSVWKEIEGFRSGETEAALWEDFSEQKLAELGSMLDDLEQSASARSPCKQYLLWAGRDHLQPILQGKAGVDDLKFLEHMNLAHNRLRREGCQVTRLVSDAEEVRRGPEAG